MRTAYPLRVQAIRSRGQNPRLYVSFPLALAAAIGLEPGEEVQWELLDRGELEMVGVNICHNGDGRRKQQKGAVRFVRFGEQEFPLADLGVGADGIQLAADDNRWINTGMTKNCGAH